jgi:hypothetical protein
VAPRGPKRAGRSARGAPQPGTKATAKAKAESTPSAGHGKGKMLAAFVDAGEDPWTITARARKKRALHPPQNLCMVPGPSAYDS